MSITFQVHWLSVTVWANEDYGLKMWEVWFEHDLGPLHPTGHGGKGFRKLYKALVESKLYTTPINQDILEGKEYFSIELPGKACEAIEDKLIQEFIVTTDRFEDAKITRLDMAWDGVGFEPETVKQAIDNEQLRSYARRSSMQYIIHPYEQREDGQLGTSAVRLGSNQSSRLLRVYDKHGPVRVELQSRDKRADLIARDVLRLLPRQWFDPALGHLRDYIDFIDPETKVLLPWWSQFIHNQDRAQKVVADAKQVELSRLVAYLKKQASPSLSVMADVIGAHSVDALIIEGRRTRGKKYDGLLQAAAKEKKL